MLQWISTVAIMAEARTSGGARARVMIDRFADSLEAVKKAGDLECEVDEHLIFARGTAINTDENRREYRIDSAYQTMRQEALLTKGPEQAVQMNRLLLVGAVNQDAQSAGADARHQPTGQQKAVAATV